MPSTTPKSFPGVMISSTFTDLQEHRAALIQILQREEMYPVTMETKVTQASEDLVSSSLNMVRNSSAYIGLISHKYGQVPDDKTINPCGLSLTQLEYELAQKLGLPTLVFIMGEDYPVPPREVEGDAAKKEKLAAFRELAKKGRIYSVFNSIEAFKLDAAHRLARLREEIAAQKPVKIQKPRKRLANAKSTLQPAAPELYPRPPYVGSHEFVGRTAELAQISDWSADANPYPLLVFEAMGGSGKSMLTWEWVNKHATRNRTDWAGRFWYSFYESGARMNEFCVYALAYMKGVPLKDFDKKNIRELSALLLEEMRLRPWLVVLDGLERILVAYNRSDAGVLADEEMDNPEDKIADRDPRNAKRQEDDDLLRLLAAAGPSKILVSTRLVPKVLVNASGQPVNGVQLIRLGGLRPPDAEELFRKPGVKGDAIRIQNFLSRNCGCHPLVVGVLAGLVANYLPDPGNFDAWEKDEQQGGAALNLAALDLVQRKNHILRFALVQLSEPCKQLLKTLSFFNDVIDYETLKVLTPFVEASDPDNKKLVSTVNELKERGFLQQDGKHLNLHPVVRGVVTGEMDGEEKEMHGQKVVDYFSSKQVPRFTDAKTLDDVLPVLKKVQVLQQIGKLEEAADLWAGDLSAAVLFRIFDLHKALEVTKGFFTRYDELKPGITDEEVQANLKNDLSVIYSGLGFNEQVYKLSIQIIEFALTNNFLDKLIAYLINFSVYYSSIDRPSISLKLIEYGTRLANLLGDPNHEFISRYNLFSRLIELGRVDAARKERDWLMARRNYPWSFSVYRGGSVEFWNCQLNFFENSVSATDFEEAFEACNKTHHTRYLIYLLQLRAEWQAQQQNWEAAEKDILQALEMISRAGVNSNFALVLLLYIQIKQGTAIVPEGQSVALEEIERTVASFYTSLIWEALGNKDKALQAAEKTYRAAWLEGEPYVDRYNLNQSRELIERLGGTIPQLEPYDESKAEKLPFEDKLLDLLKQLEEEKARKEKEDEENEDE